MSMMKVLCVLCVCVYVKASVLTGKGLYCKDPDIGSFHPVNSTWSSTTFCGNYTCKIRKKTLNTTSENIPQVVNIKDISIDGMDSLQSHTEMDLDQSNAGSETHITIAERPPAVKAILHEDLLTNINDPVAKTELLKNIQDKIYTSLSDKEDRYLTDEEISTITALLKVVKKSDLEALLEIYTLAKDIFKEIDATSVSHNLVNHDNTNNSRETSKTKIVTSSVSVSHPYFYNPLINQWFKVNEAEAKTITPASAFHGPLLLKNYYKKIPSAEYINMGTARPCNQQITSQNSTSAYRTPEVPSPYHWVIPRPEPRTPPLPPPFAYLYQNDATYPYPDIHYTKPISMKSFDISRPETLLTPELRADKSQSKTAVNDASSNLLHKILAKSKIGVNLLPQWQTDELSTEAIEDVRANILQKSEKRYNIFPLRRMVKLEKVGKVMKLDDELMRRKRETTNEQEQSAEVEYEVFLEKMTCNANLELGFFRVGNLSQPFPACCPVKIER